MKPTNDPNTQTSRSLVDKTSVKLLIMGVITLVLLIPVGYISGLISERQQLNQRVIDEINRQWGPETGLFGPVLQIPLDAVKTQADTVQTNNSIVWQNHRYLYLFPDDLKTSVNIEAQPKKRGIYRTTVYRARAQIKGHFVLPEKTDPPFDPDLIDWSKARILFFTTNTKGITEPIKWQSPFGEETFRIYAGEETVKKGLNAFEVRPFGQNPFGVENRMDFNIEYRAKGSRQFRIYPVGKTTRLTIRSNWPDIKYDGAFLPDNKTVRPDGSVEAHWKIISYQRPYRQIYNELPSAGSFDFGADFLVPMNAYTKTHRSVKYAYLIIFLTFMFFFVTEKRLRQDIHYFQYFLIGLALVIFYTLLLSISEHLTFDWAYVLSTLATLGLIGWYAKSILGNLKLALRIMTGLGLLYTYIFVIIRLKNYALLVGSIGLFLIVAFLMSVSRQIKWKEK